MGRTIKSVAALTGVPLHTLRAWERRYGVPRPRRHAANRYRLYDEQDIADVLWMKRQVEAGVSPAQASARLNRTPDAPSPAGAPPAPTLANLQSELFDALVRRDEATARQILDEAWSAVAPAGVLLQVIHPTLRQIGDHWQRNLLSVEQEHFASNLVRQRLHALIQAQAAARFNAPRLVSACAPEEQHEVGLLMVTLLACRAGWDVTYLGQRTPLAELHRSEGKARAILISVSTVTGLASLVPLWAAPLPATPLFFGGDIFNCVPELGTHLPGGMLGEDCATAVEQLAALPGHTASWKPPRRLLQAALELQQSRLRIVDETVRQCVTNARFVTDHARRNTGARAAVAAELIRPAFFLTEALVSALAFDTPALMDAQGEWAALFFPAHHIPLQSVELFLQLYVVSCERALPPGAVKPVRELVRRFTARVQ